MKDRIEFKLDLSATERYQEYAPYTIRNLDGEIICVIFGGAAAMVAEMVCRAFEGDPNKYPGSREIFERHDKQEGITRKYDAEAGKYKTYVHGVLEEQE